MSLRYETPEYFLDFQCLGADCEDTCCQRWEIKLDKRHYRLLEDAMSSDETERKLFRQYIKINEQAVSGDHDYAFISVADSGYCPMLSDEGLCSIHSKYGVQPLGNVCAFYPRVISRREERIEMSGAISCPEVARRCLLADNKPRYVRFSPSTLPRPREYPIQRELPTTAQDHYARYFHLVRKSFLSIIAEQTYNLDTRLYLLISLAQNLSSFYHKDCVVDDENQINRTVEAITDVENMQKLSAYVAQYEASEPFGLIVINSILQIKQANSPHEKTSQLAAAILDSFSNANDSTGSHAEILQSHEFYVFYQQCADVCLRAFAEELEKYLARYLENVLYREWFYTMPDTFTYMQMLLVRLAMLRYLLTADPKIVAIAKQHLEQGDGKALCGENLSSLEDEVVHVVYNFARAIDQNTPFLQVIYNALSEQQMMNFDYSLPFIKL